MRCFLANRGWIAVLVFFTAFLLLGLDVFEDYGVSWDERVQRKYGEEVYRYVTSGDQELFVDRHRYYGPLFELLLYSAERALGLDDTRNIYLMRHLITFLTFWVGVLSFFGLCKHEFRSWKIGLLGSCVLILSPRIFAHAFYNSKDIPFMCMFTVGMFTLVRYLETKTLLRAAVHGAVCALLIDIRIVGVFLVALTLAFSGYKIVELRASKTEIKRIGKGLGVYLAILVCLTVALWPTLWRDPARNFVRVFEGMSNFPWEATVLYMGRGVWSTDLPWHYLPVWIAISTPVVMVALFIVGLAVSAKAVFERTDTQVVTRRFAALSICWFFMPLVYSVVFGAVLYDAWRHVFFVYPAFVMLALVGLISLLKAIDVRFRGLLRRALTLATMGLVALNLATTVMFMVRSHPHQNVYFNILTGGIRGAEGKFELDYWGLSYRKALEYILRNDGQEAIPLYAATPPGAYNADILEPQARKRLVFVTKPYKAQYYVTNFRWERPGRLPGSEIYAVKIDGVRIMTVRRLDGPSQ